jgi:hypothetical protein
LLTPEEPLALTGINKVIKIFDRNTTCVATGLLAPVIFAALMVAVQERHAKEARQTTGDLLLHANPAAIFDIVGPNEKAPAK